MAVIFGDGGAAVCMEGIDTDKNVGVIASCLHADGNRANDLYLELPSSKLKERIPIDLIKNSTWHYPQMDGKAVFKGALKKLPQVTQETLKKANMKIENVNLIIPHQANL